MENDTIGVDELTLKFSNLTTKEFSWDILNTVGLVKEYAASIPDERFLIMNGAKKVLCILNAPSKETAAETQNAKEWSPFKKTPSKKYVKTLQQLEKINVSEYF